MDRYNITDKNILFIQGKTDNKAYVRVLLPKEAKIKESSYINITELEKHQLVEFYTRTRRLEKVIHTIEYTIPNTTCLDILPQKEVIRYMLHSKFILCPSTYDSNPNTCKEAISTGCIPIISKNIGTHEKYPDYLVCKDLSENEWVQKLSELLDKYESIKDCYKNIHFEKMDIQNLFDV